MVDKSQWPVVDPGFEMLPPKLERSASRPRVKRIKSRGELGKRGPYNAKDASSLVILRRDAVRPLLNLVLNCHQCFLPRLGKLKLLSL